MFYSYFFSFRMQVALYCNSLVVYQLPRRPDVMLYTRVTLTHSALLTKPLRELMSASRFSFVFSIVLFPLWQTENHALQICSFVCARAGMTTDFFRSQLVVQNISQLVGQWMLYKAHKTQVIKFTNCPLNPKTLMVELAE